MTFEFSGKHPSKSQTHQSLWDHLAEQVPFTLAHKRKQERIKQIAQQEAKTKAMREAEEEWAKLEARKKVEEEIAKKQAIKDDLARQDEELISAMDTLRLEKTKKMQADRALELTERKFNETMTTPDELREAVISGEEGIHVSEIEYEGKQIPVYELEGYPIRFLQHVVDYRTGEGGQIFNPGINVSKQILQDPSRWVSDIREVEQHNEQRDANMMAYNISTSYIDADINLGRNNGCKSRAGVTYGFSYIPGDSLISLNNGDGRTMQTAGRGRSRVMAYKDPADFAGYIGNPGYNEVALRRYSENGQPLLPTYMIVHDRRRDESEDQLTEATLRHAAYFSIPIVRIHDEVYMEKELEKIANNIENLNEDIPYAELISVLLSANKSNMFPHDFYVFREEFTDEKPKSFWADISYYGKDNTKDLPENIRSKFINLITEIEPARRLDYIEKYLSNNGENNVDVHLSTTEIRTGDYRERIGINIPGIPKTCIRSDSPEYLRIKKAVDRFISLGGGLLLTGVFIGHSILQ